MSFKSQFFFLLLRYITYPSKKNRQKTKSKKQSPLMNTSQKEETQPKRQGELVEMAYSTLTMGDKYFSRY